MVEAVETAKTVTMQWGQILAILGAVLSALLAGIGSGKAVGKAGEASAGVLTEKPDLFGKLSVIQILPGTQGLYGFLIAVILMGRIGLMGGGLLPLTTDQGLMFLIAALPMAFGGWLSAIYQGRVAISAIIMVGERPETSGRGITMTVMVEIYAILSLLVSLLMVVNVPI